MKSIARSSCCFNLVFCNSTRLKSSLRNAFSLVELLVALIIISLIISSFMPVLTKKLKHQNIALTSGTINCKKYGDKCVFCDKTSCSLCSNQMNLPEGKYVDIHNNCAIKNCPLGCSKCEGVNCINCTEGYGYNSLSKTCQKCSAGTYSIGKTQACTTCPSGFISSEASSSCSECRASEHKRANAAKTACENVFCSTGQYIENIICKTCPSGTYQDAGNHQELTCQNCPDGYICENGVKNKITCPENCKNCVSDEICLKCEDEYKLVDGKCERKNCLQIGNICVEKYNAGDDGGLAIPNNLVELINVKETGVTGSEHNRAICYKGKSANECDSATSSYSGCYRTVCSWYAAVKICEYYGLRLPTTSEARRFGDWSTELQLCSNTTGSNVTRCQRSSKCQSADDTGVCAPDAVWCQRKDGLKVPSYDNGTRNGGANFIFNSSWSVEHSGEHNCNSGGYSVRCVKDL